MRLITSIFAVLLITPILVNCQTSNCDNVYVWSFSSKSGEKTFITETLTNEIEDLVTGLNCVVLQRRNYGKLQKHVENEVAIFSLEGVSDSATSQLKLIKADKVIFGEVEQDFSFNISLRLSLEDLATKQIKTKTIILKEGDIFDSNRRQNILNKSLINLFSNNSYNIDGNDSKKLVTGSVVAETNSSTWIEIKTKSGKIVVPVTLIIDMPREKGRHYDYSILFDLTNKGDYDMRIVDIFIEVTSWHELEEITNYIPAAGLGEERKYFCTIDKELKKYKANFSEKGKYLKLQKGELETVDMKMNALSEGWYMFKVIVEYSIGGKTDSIEIGPFTERFLDRGRIFSLPRH